MQRQDLRTTTVRERYALRSFISSDGARIAYRQLGQGPGLVVLHGAMESAQSHMQLAQVLADAFTVYLPERRGHSLGFPFADGYGMQKEVDDLSCLLAETGTHNVFGVSAGGLICLQAALRLPAVRKTAVYEPALFLHGAPAALMERYDREIAQGKVAAALVTAMKGAQMGPPVFNLIPRGLLEMLTNMAIKGEEKKATAEAVTMRMFAPTLHYDFLLINEMAPALESFRAVRSEVLLLGGSESPAYLKEALDALEGVLPRARRVEFPGLDHGGSSDISTTNRSGNPEVVAEELRRFFA